MRRGLIAAVLVLGALALVPASAGAQTVSGVEGTVLDTTCATGCEPACPPPPVCRAPGVCAQRGAGASIVCPLTRGPAAPVVCTEVGCPGPAFVRYPPYEGTAASVIVRRAGSAAVLRRLAVTEGRFSAALEPGRYVLRAHVAEPCWSGSKQVVEVGMTGMVPVSLKVRDACVAHPDAPSAG